VPAGQRQSELRAVLQELLLSQVRPRFLFRSASVPLYLCLRAPIHLYSCLFLCLSLLVSSAEYFCSAAAAPFCRTLHLSIPLLRFSLILGAGARTATSRSRTSASLRWTRSGTRSTLCAWCATTRSRTASSSNVTADRIVVSCSLSLSLSLSLSSFPYLSRLTGAGTANATSTAASRPSAPPVDSRSLRTASTRSVSSGTRSTLCTLSACLFAGACVRALVTVAVTVPKLYLFVALALVDT
jgi:hypothetical protein